jgi:P pilus assembly chaperone PapD
MESNQVDEQPPARKKSQADEKTLAPRHRASLFFNPTAFNAALKEEKKNFQEKIAAIKSKGALRGVQASTRWTSTSDT